MNTEKPAVKYEFLSSSEITGADALAQLGKEMTSATIEQAKTGYLATGSVGDNENRAFKYSYFPEVEAAAQNGKLDLKSFSSNDFAKFEAEIEQQDDLGMNLLSLSFSDGEGAGTWNALFGESESDVVYFSSDHTEEFEDLLEDVKTDDRNLSLLDLEYGAGTWVATYSDLEDKNPDADNRDLESSQTFDKLTGQIDSQLDKGDVSLVNIEYGDGLWFAKYDSDPDLNKPLESSYFSSKDYQTFQTEVETQKDAGFDLVDVEYIEGSWYGVFNESVADTDYQSASIDRRDYDMTEIETAEII